MTNGDTNDVVALVPNAMRTDTSPVSQQEPSRYIGDSGAREWWAAYEQGIRDYSPSVSVRELARREAMFYYYYEHYVASLMGDRKTGFCVVDQQELVNEDARLRSEELNPQDVEDESYWDEWEYFNYYRIDWWLNKYQTYDPYMPFEFEGIGQNMFRAKLEEDNGWELYALDHVGLRDVHRLADDLTAQEPSGE